MDGVMGQIPTFNNNGLTELLHLSRSGSGGWGSEDPVSLSILDKRYKYQIKMLSSILNNMNDIKILSLSLWFSAMLIVFHL